MLCFLRFYLLLTLELLSTLALGSSGFASANSARVRRLMAFPRLRMPLGTKLVNDVLAKYLGVADKGGRMAFGWTCVDTTTELCATACLVSVYNPISSSV